jgi:outer membrane protein
MKKGLLILATMMSLSMSAQEKWTLRECIDYAMQNSITLKQAHLTKQTATETRKQSQAALFPSLSASSNQSFGYRLQHDQLHQMHSPLTNSSSLSARTNYF